MLIESALVPLHLDLVNDIDRESEKARREGFDDLVIPKSYRDLLVALVDSHGTGPQRRQGTNKTHSKAPLLTQIDLVRGKGQGLIILLHGPPGSGKTSTAETIAAYTRRPLYSITCGDIGTDPMVVEAKLLEHMQRADKWGCVLLLDEADVFLVQRDWSVPDFSFFRPTFVALSSPVIIMKQCTLTCRLLQV